MKQISWVKLLISLAICYAAALIGSAATNEAIPTWYRTLSKPFFTPPNWVFGPVWTILYTVMGVSLYLLWNSRENGKNKKSAYYAFTAQLLLNISWSLIFFGLKSPLVAFLIILLLTASLLWTYLRFRRVVVLASWLLIPYIIWVSYASILNLAIVLLN